MGLKYSAQDWSLLRKKNDTLAVQYEDVHVYKKVINDPYTSVVIQEEVLCTLKYKVFRGSSEIYLVTFRDNFMEKISDYNQHRNSIFRCFQHLKLLELVNKCNQNF